MREERAALDEGEINRRAQMLRGKVDNTKGGGFAATLARIKSAKAAGSAPKKQDAGVDNDGFLA